MSTRRSSLRLASVLSTSRPDLATKLLIIAGIIVKVQEQKTGNFCITVAGIKVKCFQDSSAAEDYRRTLSKLGKISVVVFLAAIAGGIGLFLLKRKKKSLDATDRNKELKLVSDEDLHKFAKRFYQYKDKYDPPQGSIFLLSYKEREQFNALYREITSILESVKGGKIVEGVNRDAFDLLVEAGRNASTKLLKAMNLSTSRLSLGTLLQTKAEETISTLDSIAKEYERKGMVDKAEVVDRARRKVVGIERYLRMHVMSEEVLVLEEVKKYSTTPEINNALVRLYTILDESPTIREEIAWELILKELGVDMTAIKSR